MDFKTEIVDEIKKIKEFESITVENLKHGWELSKNVKEFDSPDEYLNGEELRHLSAFYEYRAEEESIALRNDPDYEPYIFDEDDLVDEDDDE